LACDARFQRWRGNARGADRDDGIDVGGRQISSRNRLACGIKVVASETNAAVWFMCLSLPSHVLELKFAGFYGGLSLRTSGSEDAIHGPDMVWFGRSFGDMRQ